MPKKKKRFKRKILKSFCGYPIDIHLVDTNDLKELDRQYGLGIDEVYASASYITRPGKKKGTFEYGIIILFNTRTKYDNKITSSTVAHECFHASGFVFDHIGEEERCEEPRAYLLDNIHKECMKFLKLKN